MGEPREPGPVIAIVDDDPAVREGLQALIQSAGWRAETFASAQEFLAHLTAEAPSCVVLDLQLPGLSGLDLQKRMAEVGLEIPIVFLTGHGDIPKSVQAMKQGAVDFLTKPVDGEELLKAIRAAVARHQAARWCHDELDALHRRLATLTPREREVLQHVVAGKLNKQIAADLEASEKTIKIHRARVMEKMQVRSVAALVRLAARLGIG
jgi:FixJ family two-component response regulator